VFSHIPTWLQGVDRVVLWSLTPLAILFLLSGLDDLAVDFAWVLAWWRRRNRPLPERAAGVPPRSIAIFVPLWKEHGVIEGMLAHNLGTVRYPDYHFFVGAYPNDLKTQDAVRRAAQRYPNVHLALCPHDGPTSKADCLNWIYQHVGLYEEETGEYFDIIVTHDAEDLIHPEELRWINFHAERYDFIQIPVLALATPLTALIHGVYCDEFAEYHARDMVVRSEFGCFLPGSGVGMGYRRDALEKLAAANSNQVFEPVALTEDYECGLRMHRLGCSQLFLPLAKLAGDGSFLATREYFPKSWRTALRQRTRWVMGIALQGWERFGWRGTPGEVYWLWRDRKGLVGSPLGVVANSVFFYGLATALWTRAGEFEMRLAFATMGLQGFRIGVRMACVARVYGWLFAAGVPVRIFFANALNAAATVCALAFYVLAKWKGHPLRWLKTDHAYPSRAALRALKRRLGDILVASGYINGVIFREALAACPEGVRLGAHLIQSGLLSEKELYEALSLQQGIPVLDLQPEHISRRAIRALPSRVVAKWQVLPFNIAEGALYLASSDVPKPEMNDALRRFTALEIRFHLVTPSTFRRLEQSLEIPAAV